MNEICVYEISACRLRANIIPIIKMHNVISVKLDYISIKFARSSLTLRETNIFAQLKKIYTEREFQNNSSNNNLI